MLLFTLGSTKLTSAMPSSSEASSKKETLPCTVSFICEKTILACALAIVGLTIPRLDVTAPKTFACVVWLLATTPAKFK